MNIKTKIRLILIILFATVAFFAILGSYFLEKQSKLAVSLLQDNYRTMQYTRGMSFALNDIIQTISLESTSLTFRRKNLRAAFGKFERYLDLQEKNITETGESDISFQLRTNYESFRDTIWVLQTAKELTPSAYMLMRNMQDLLEDVYQINEAAILMKTEEARKASDRISLSTGVFGFFFFVFAVISLFYFPDYIANPIKNLTEKIRLIAKKDYSSRIKVDSDDEFGEMAKSFNLMAAKLNEYEKVNISQVLLEKQRVETIISRMNEPIIGMDKNKVILFCNTPTVELTGIDEEMLVGKPANEVYEQNPILKTILKEVVKNEKIETVSLPAMKIKKDGENLFFNKDIIKISLDENDEIKSKVSGYVIILKNITKLKEKDIAKTKFLATLSHELKTPISVIGLSLNLLENEKIGKMNTDQKDLTKTIRKNASRLLDMINELLDVTKLESGKMKFYLEVADPQYVVKKAVQNLKSLIAEKNIEIIEKFEQDLPPIKMDISKTTGILINFLSNAVRYSEKNGEIDIALKRKDDFIEFSVKDYGIGLKKEDQIKIFKRYSRAKHDTTAGTGLGLAIAKDFVKAQGGNIGVESEKGKGARFYFRLPVQM